jgi:2,3-bisphosphoglycerate-independent phosphoglycerate mutase
MKYVILLCDGMADYKLEKLGNKTPMTVSDKPAMNALAKKSTVGLVRTVARGLNPGSDVANLSVLGYDPFKYYSGRSPLEAASIGIKLDENDIAMRINLVTLSDEENYEDKTMVDYCADDISTKEASEIIKTLKQEFDNEEFEIFCGFSYRHCLVWHNGLEDLGFLTPPHDITGKNILKYIPKSENSKKLLDLMQRSIEILKNHPVNIKRIENGHRPANAIWLWGEGKSKKLDSFKEKFGVSGAVISAVDLLKGIGKLAQMDVIEVEGATGYIDTNFEGKMEATLEALKTNDLVYLHIEAPDECGHRFEIDNKVKSLELIDKKVLAPLLEGLEEYEDYKIMILPDHATPLELKTHTSDPVPFLMYRKQKQVNTEIEVFDEENSVKTGVFIENGPDIMKTFIEY